MLEWLDGWILTLGASGYWVLGLAAAVEYVFPPFPGDTVTLLGGIYAVRGNRSIALVLLAITTGSVLGAALDYLIGVKLASRLERLRVEGTARSKQHDRVLALARAMRRRGTMLLLLNRFLPAVRGLLFVAAGAARLPFGRVMGLGMVSALVWNALLVGAGFAVGGNAEKLEAWVRTYYQILYVVLFGGAVVLGFHWLRRRRSAKVG